MSSGDHSTGPWRLSDTSASKSVQSWWPLSSQRTVACASQHPIKYLLIALLFPNCSLKHQPNNKYLPTLNKGLNFIKISPSLQKPQRCPRMFGLKLPERSSEGSHVDPSTQALSVTIREKDAPRGRFLRVSKSYLNVTYKVN